MKLIHICLLVISISLSSAAMAAPIYTRSGCQYMCGNVKIPYPFGIGANCYLNEWYAVDCNSSTPYLSGLNNLEVLVVNLENQTVSVNVSTISDCRNPVRNSTEMLSVDLGGSPFLVSRLHNRFTVEGCGNAFISEQGNVLTGCSTICQNRTVNNCYGINCCQTTIPYYLKTYSVNVSGLERQGPDCGSAFLVDENFYASGRFSGQSFVPVTLQWTLTLQVVNSVDCILVGRELNLGNGSSEVSYRCLCGSFEEGNPYLLNGCELAEECASCSGRGYCSYFGPPGEMNITCNPYPGGSKSSELGVILGVCLSIGILILTASSFALYKVIQRTKEKRRKARFFKRNGGLLLKQQESADEGLVNKTRLFTSRELEKATDYFNENRVLGRGGQGTVYKGMLTDGRIVAVKKSKVVDESQLEQFINEVVILSQVNHRNVVKLLGCCLETEVPLLVSEFVPSGTLYEHIHDESDEFPISWNMRLQIAAEVAGALAYLHSATSIPIYHRDIKSTNILLDDKYRAKVSDFGTSRFVSLDQTHLTTLVKGTFGYLDPEYFQSSQFTEKSDVYSFGVVLVELLTGERPISLTRFGEHRSLATHFIMALEEGRLMSIIDMKVIKEGSRDEIMAVADLAMRCLNLNGKNRPTMKEVASELESIRMSHMPSAIQTSFGDVKKYKAGEEDFLMLSYGESTSGTSLEVSSM